MKPKTQSGPAGSVSLLNVLRECVREPTAATILGCGGSSGGAKMGSCLPISWGLSARVWQSTANTAGRALESKNELTKSNLLLLLLIMTFTVVGGDSQLRCGLFLYSSHVKRCFSLRKDCTVQPKDCTVQP